MLNTPLGEITISLNGCVIPFQAEKLENSHIGQLGLPVFAVDGRYKISVPLVRAARPLSLACQFGFESAFRKSGINNGERLALKTWENGSLMLSLGTEDEIPGIDVQYLERGVKVCLTEKAEIAEVRFGVAWVYRADDEQKENDTWFAADPTYV